MGVTPPPSETELALPYMKRTEPGQDQTTGRSNLNSLLDFEATAQAFRHIGVIVPHSGPCQYDSWVDSERAL